MMSKFKGKPMRSRITVEEIMNNGQENFSIDDRLIDANTVKHFGVRKLFNEVDGRLEGYFFPVTKKGKITGYIHCNPSLSKKNGRFTVVGDVSVEHDLLGQKQATNGKKVFIVEGFWDIMTAWQTLNKNKPENFTGIPTVVSPALGIGSPGENNNAKKQIGNNIEFIDQYTQKVVCFDNDDKQDVNVGQEAVKDLAIVLKEFYNCVLPVNDCNEMLAEGKERELYFALQQAPKYEHGSVVSGLPSDRVKEEIMTPMAEGIMIDSLPKTSFLLQGIRPRELTVMLAPPKSGKTSICKMINYELIKAGVPTMGIYLEEDITKTRQSFVALHAGVHLPKFRKNPEVADKDKVEEAFQLLAKPHVLFFDDVHGRMTAQSVISQLEWAAIKGVKVIILDHISFIFSGDASGSNERKAIDQLMTDLASFVKQSGVHIIVVAHVTRDKNKVKPRNKDGSVKYPYWYEVEDQDGRGSGAFEQVCWNMIAIDKEITEDRSRGFTRTKVLLNREWDYTGIGDKLTMDKHTGRLKSVEEEY